MFNAFEAVNNIIDEINVDYYESCYDAIYEELCDRVDSGKLSLEFAELVNKEAYAKYVNESEEDYSKHMKKKEDASKRIGKDISSLPNKKYIKDGIKADRYYSGREAIKSEPQFKEGRKNLNDNQYNTINKSIDYIRRKAADTSDENSEKKVNLATKAIKNITKTNLDGDVAIQVSKGKGEDGREQKQLYSLAYAKELDGNAFYGYGSTGKRIKLDKTKTYYHASSKGGLKYLTPQKEGYSNRNDYKGDDINGNPIESKSSYIYPSKRIYITSDKPDKKFGSHLYRLLKIPEYGYTNRIGYYIEPNGPIPVEEIDV